MKRILFMLAVLGMLCASACAETQTFSYGTSELGRELVCVRIGEGNAEKSLLMTFGTHGFEGAQDRDGRYLVQIAEKIIAHYEEHPQSLNGHALYVVPCVNPDGLEEGITEEGFGRLNAREIDINRDFPSDWKPMRTARYRTGDAPFATAEARAIRDLTQQIAPTWGVDVHGWINGVYGSRELAKPFEKAFRFAYRTYQSGGKLSQWMEEQTEGAILVELPAGPARKNYVDNCTHRLIQALDEWFASV